MIDLSVEEAGQYVDAMRAHALDTVFLGTPTSTPERLKLVAQYSSGFIYLVSRTGVTGERDSVSQSVRPLVDTMRSLTDLPLAVGFGISTPAHVADVGAVADGVVVGSAVVRTLEKYGQSAELEQRLEDQARLLASGLARRAVPVRTA
jgi:tryptophan synthase alpha chain